MRNFKVKDKDFDTKRGEIQNEIWKNFIEYFCENNTISNVYNKTRNYLTKKEYSKNKFKLNFSNSTLAGGWDLNKEDENDCIILKDKNYFYLCIINTIYSEIENAIDQSCNSDNYYEKMVYKLVPSPNKMLPKVFFSKKGEEIYLPSEEIFKIRNTASHTKNGAPQKGYKKVDFDIKACRKMIDFFKKSIEKTDNWKVFNFKFSPTSSYNSIDDFYKEFESQSYKISFSKFDKEILEQFVENEKIYLFKIYNKDFSQEKKKRGKDNLHTMYWNTIFSLKNMEDEDVVVKMNGEAELFYRKASLSYDEKKRKEGHHAGEKGWKDKFKYPILKDKRFSEDKMFFHCPVTLNFNSKDNNNLNKDVFDLIKGKKKEVNIIGIDRGERNLIYYSVVDQNGTILDQGSLNTIEGHAYQEKLDEREQKRKQARLDWDAIGNIKDLKAGYISQVVHKISSLIVEHNAVVVLEDLNVGFKKGRFKFEKQVYQKFERALIEKLNYLVFKDYDVDIPGGNMKAYQLTNKFISFQKLGKQSGILFYTTAGYTSKTDPITGYMKSLYHSYSDLEKTQKFFEKFDSIVYNGSHFEFSYNLKNLKGMTGSYDDKKEFDELKLDKKWVIHSNIDRSQWIERKLTEVEKNDEKYQNARGGKWRFSQLVDINENIKNLFEKEGIVLVENFNCKEFVCSKENKEQFEKSKFLPKLVAYFNRLLDMRVYDEQEGKKIDYLVSPVPPFYDSRKIEGEDAILPVDSDANGAYNIARKGILMLERIQESREGEKLNLIISKTDWANYAQSDSVVNQQKQKYEKYKNK